VSTSRRRAGLLALCLCCCSGLLLGAGEWASIDYAPLIDRRQPTHSGDSVGTLLKQLDGRPLPVAGERPSDLIAHRSLEPLLERYAFVMSDLLDTLEPPAAETLIEVGSLWQPGQAQPAWVELFSSRRMIAESDGGGHLRAILPWQPKEYSPLLPEASSVGPAQAAWREAWPILRHLLAAERRRLADDAMPLKITVHPYRHLPERSEFQLGLAPWTVEIRETLPTGVRPPLELASLRAFLDSGLRLEGGRLDEEGRLTLFGSPVEQPPTLLGRALSLSDLAVAYRAVFHGGLAEPYMSLDRGYSPAQSIVNYGGRLRDTVLGAVSLRCDIRFKTFSLGIDIASGEDTRSRIRERLPAFRTHLEALSENPASSGTAGQQTRLWFYPDRVDLTLSDQGDVLVLRDVRMSAASERIEDGAGGRPQKVHPWTEQTVSKINDDYDALGEIFPEMADLDQVVRLLSLFAWLKQVEGEGLAVPELDNLLAVELPQFYTPRDYPQLLAFNALPEKGRESEAVTVFDRVAVGEALDRLNLVGGRPLPARRRYQRAVAALSPARAEHAALLERFKGFRVEQLDDSSLDLLSQQAERLTMHETVLGTLEIPRRRAVGERMRAGEKLRIFSVGIGGLDLGMGSVVSRAGSRRASLLGGGAVQSPATTGSRKRAAGRGAAEAREAWRRDPLGLPATVMPVHGSLAQPTHSVERRQEAVDVVYAADAPESRRRTLRLKGKKIVLVEREEGGLQHAYLFEKSEDGYVARNEPPTIVESPEAEPILPVPGLLLMEVVTGGDGPLEATTIPLRLTSNVSNRARSLEADFPRPVMQRLVRGPQVDPTPGQPLGGLVPLAADLGPVEALMLLAQAGQNTSATVGEENPALLARAFGEWWGKKGEKGALIGVDGSRSVERWSVAPVPDASAVLWLPDDAFSAADPGMVDALRSSWGAAPVSRSSEPDFESENLVLLVSGEAPADLASRLRRLATDQRMAGRLLAVWPLQAPVRESLPRLLLAEGQLAGIGLADGGLVSRRTLSQALREIAQALGERMPEQRRVERLPAPFLWYF